MRLMCMYMYMRRVLYQEQESIGPRCIAYMYMVEVLAQEIFIYHWLVLRIVIRNFVDF